MTSEEYNLVQRAKNGDALAFARLHDIYYPIIYRFFYYRISNLEDIENLSSDLFIRVTEELGFYKPGGIPFTYWMYTLAKDLLMEFSFERGDHRQQMESTPPQPTPTADAASLKQSLAHLDPDERELVITRLIEERSSHMAAREINKSIRNTRILQYLALQKLARIAAATKPDRETALVLDEYLDTLQQGSSVEAILQQDPEKAEGLAPLLKMAAFIAHTPDPVPPDGTAIASKARLMRVLSEQKAEGWRQKQMVMDELGSGFHQGPGKGIIIFVFSLVLVFILLSSIFVTANESLPGSPFYPIKLAMQEFHLLFIFDPEERQRQQDFIYWVRQQDLLTAIEQERIPEADAQTTLTAMPNQ